MPSGGATWISGWWVAEPEPARRDDAGARPERRDAPDREAVAPVAVGHAEGGPHDPRQARDVGHLLEDALIHLGEQRLGRVDARRHAHAGLLALRGPPHPVGEPYRPP